MVTPVFERRAYIMELQKEVDEKNKANQEAMNKSKRR
tara:strand:- start:12146 stop:12256 length:111 start_codon:yes stop_codon:yes gene_type:complete